MYRKVYMDFQDGSGFVDMSNLIKYDSLSVQLQAFSDNWHFAQNTCTLSVIYDSTYYEKLRYNTNEIILRIVDWYEDAAITTEGSIPIATEDLFYLQLEDRGFEPFFYGKIPPTKSRRYNGILNLTTFDLEAIDEIDLLRVPAGDICYRNYYIANPLDKSHSILHQLCYLAGLDDSKIDQSIVIGDIVEAFTPPNPTDTILDILDTLLFEYGWTLTMSNGGLVSALPWIQEGSPSFQFDETNIVRDVTIIDSISTRDGAEVTYYELGEATTTSGNVDMLLYRDNNLPYDHRGNFSGYPVPGGYSYPPATNVIDETTGSGQRVYQDYDDSAVKYWTNDAIVRKLDYNYKAFESDYSAIVATSGWRVDWRGDSGLILTTSNFENRRAELKVSNPTGGFLNLYYLNVYGRVLYKTTERTSKIENFVGATDIDKYVSTFIFRKEIADILVAKLAAQHNMNGTMYTFYSEVIRPVGEYVTIVMGDGTNQPCLITSMTWDKRQAMYSYKLKAYSEDVGTLASQQVSVTPVSPIPEQISITSNRGDIFVSANADGSNPNLTNAYFDIFVFRDGVDDTLGWSLSATASGISGSFGTGAQANRWTVSTFSSDPIMTGTVAFTASRTGFADRTLVRNIHKVITLDAVSATTVSTYAPKYLGRYMGAHPTKNKGDWWTIYDTDDSPIQRGVYYYDGSTIARITTSSSVTMQAKLIEALADIAWAEANGFGVSADYGIETMFQSIGAVTALIKTLVAQQAFIDELFVQNIEVPSKGAIEYFNKAGSTRRGVRLEQDSIVWGNHPIDGAFGEVAKITRKDDSNSVILDGGFYVNINTPSLEQVNSDFVDVARFVAAGYEGNIYFPSAYETHLDIFNIATRTVTSGTIPYSGVVRWVCEAYAGKLFMPRDGYMDIYDIKTGTTVTKAMQSGTFRRCSCRVGNLLYLPSGSLGADMEIYNLEDMTSISVSLPHGDIDTICRYGRNLYMTAGGTDQMYIYDMDTGVVRNKTMPTSNQRNIAKQVYGKIYYPAFTGTSMEVFDALTETFSIVTLPATDNGFRRLGEIYNDVLYMPLSYSDTLQAYNIVTGSTSTKLLTTYMSRDAGVLYEGSFYTAQDTGTLFEVLELGRPCRIGAGIIESGVAPDGSRWQKTSDGMLECWGYVASISNGAQIVFPAEFNATPPYIAPHGGPNSSGPIHYDFIQAYAATATGFYITYKDSTGGNITNKPMNWRAKGLAKV